ncbi:hypothetical protein BaRGS_00009917 [Batillaria attramentaria]|uniref:Uncharacterized protein n=1 Tax=Batillaria attramentaria TaxID=370345 RepID=A0ABD0LHE1_9CAEN
MAASSPGHAGCPSPTSSGWSLQATDSSCFEAGIPTKDKSARQLQCQECITKDTGITDQAKSLDSRTVMKKVTWKRASRQHWVWYLEAATHSHFSGGCGRVRCSR